MLSGFLATLVVLGCALIPSINGFPHMDKLAATFAKSSLDPRAYGHGYGHRYGYGGRHRNWSRKQLVDVTGAHAFHPPGPGDSRGPCPAQNALANHGYLNHSGYTTVEDCTKANLEVFGLDRPFSQILCFFAQLGGSNFDTLSWAIGNTTASDPVIAPDASSTGPGPGLAQSHDIFEGDHSMFQSDWNFTNGADASDIYLPYFQQMWDDALPNGTFDDYGIFLKHHQRRVEESVQTNPCFFNGPFSGVTATPGGFVFAYRLYANNTPEHPDGTVSKETLASFFGVEIQGDGSLKKKPFGHEQIPDYWYKRARPYTVPDFLPDYAELLKADNRTAIIGGNTNGTNTFSGVDTGNYSGGVYPDLVEGNSFTCFYYRFASGFLKDRLQNKVGPGLQHLGSTIQQVLDSVFGQIIGTAGVSVCPPANITEYSTLTPYCGNILRNLTAN